MEKELNTRLNAMRSHSSPMVVSTRTDWLAVPLGRVNAFFDISPLNPPREFYVIFLTDYPVPECDAISGPLYGLASKLASGLWV